MDRNRLKERKLRTLGACLALWAASACGSVAQADGALPDARTLGVSESMLNSCAPGDPVAAQHLREKIKVLIQGATAQQLTAVRASNEYRKGFDSVSDFVGKVDAHNLHRFCSENAAGGK